MRLREEKRLEMMENYWFNSESSFTTLDPESNPNRLNIHSFGGLFLVTGISSISALGVCLFQKRQSIKIHLNSSLDSLKGYFNVKIIGRQKERSWARLKENYYSRNVLLFIFIYRSRRKSLSWKAWQLLNFHTIFMNQVMNSIWETNFSKFC